MLVPDKATSLWDVEGWAGCGEAELVSVGRGRENKEGVMEEKRKTKKKKNKRPRGGTDAYKELLPGSLHVIAKKMAGNRVVIGTDATEMRTRAPR